MLTYMLILEPVTITVIYVIAAVLGIPASALAIFLFFRHRQFARSELRLSFGWGQPPKEIPRRFRKLPVTLFALAPKTEIRNPLVTFLFFQLFNPGRESIKNVRISFEYPAKFLVDNKSFADLASFEPAVISEMSDSKTAAVMTSAMSAEQIQSIIKERQVENHQGRAQVSWELPIVRPQEGLILYDVLLLPGSGPEGIEAMGFGKAGFQNIVARLRSIQELLDYFVVNVFVFAENHDALNSRISVLRFSHRDKLDEGMKEFNKALWLGEYPKPGIYFSEPISRFVRHRFFGAGRRGADLLRDELGLIRYSTTANITAGGKTYVMEAPDQSEIEYFGFASPNYDYFNLPPEITNLTELMKWMGTTEKPLLPPLGRSKKNPFV